MNENIELLKSESWLKVKAAEIQQRKEILAAGSNNIQTLPSSKLKIDNSEKIVNFEDRAIMISKLCQLLFQIGFSLFFKV